MIRYKRQFVITKFGINGFNCKLNLKATHQMITSNLNC
jgi:hypothetical protein